MSRFKQQVLNWIFLEKIYGADKWSMPGRNLVQEAVVFFEFLEGFSTTTDLEDIQLGLTHAAYKY